ncbi:SGNH/GDSL hydrolase family protein [Aurantibacter crassamenti]|uniref:SGNH/GDSL hydrolase family protein n=1 Tax=Aurantibacter crassamenti TaxID=1837375 RepID=UPI001939B1C9|nr:SGNH/GDSL hydrolase family protein [Aurantibacter crassamenti]MBM1105467.1 SGNH/GDSL hydrolase family protein [Aurantibacter crassamenti]
MNFKRRDFIKKASLVSANILAVPNLHNCTSSKIVKNNMPYGINVVFQGDSITDGGRNKKSKGPNDFENIGMGYVFLSAASLAGEFASTNLKYYNRGVSGDKVFQLLERWSEDTIALKPDVVSILIGVNDFWHKLTNGHKGSEITYESDYRRLVKVTKNKLPNVEVIIGEPFCILDEIKNEKLEWKVNFPKYQKAAYKIAKEFDAIWIPYQSIFDKAIKQAPASYWTWDGIHPSLAGNYLISKAWLQAFNTLYK